jgi:hypothetical protein
MIGLPMAYHALHSVAICCQKIVASLAQKE